MNARSNIPNGRVKALDLMSQVIHFLFQLIPLRSQLPNVVRSFLQHRGFAQFCVGILTELRYQTVQHVESVFDVISTLLLRVDVTDPPLLLVLSPLRFALDKSASGRQRATYAHGAVQRAEAQRLGTVRVCAVLRRAGTILGLIRLASRV